MEGVTYTVDQSNMKIVGSLPRFEFQINIFQTKDSDELYAVEVQKRSGDLREFERFFEWVNEIVIRAETQYSMIKPSLPKFEEEVKGEIDSDFVDTLNRIIISHVPRSEKIRALSVLKGLENSDAVFRECNKEILAECLNTVFKSFCDELGVSYAAKMIMFVQYCDYALVIQSLMNHIRRYIENVGSSQKAMITVYEAAKCLRALVDIEGVAGVIKEYSDELRSHIVACEDVTCSLLLEKVYMKVTQSTNSENTSRWYTNE